MARRALALLLLAACGADGAASSDEQDAGGGTTPIEDAGGGDTTTPLPSRLDGGAEAAIDAAAPTPDAAANDYDHDGPFAFTTSAENVTNGAHSFTVNVYMPSSPGPHPVVSLSPGLLQPAVSYAPYGKRLASWGIAVFVRDDPGVLTTTIDVEADIGYVVATWMTTALAGKVDPAKVGLAGHSRGGKASLLAAERELAGKVRAWFGLDPVDAALFSGGDAQARDTVGSLGIPTAYLGAGLVTTCAPAPDNYEVLYAATSPPSVKLTAVGAGHTQLEDQTNCPGCNVCTPSGTADSATVLAYAVRYLTAFFARELLSDAHVGQSFEGAGAPADVAAGRVQLATKQFAYPTARGTSRTETSPRLRHPIFASQLRARDTGGSGPAPSRNAARPRADASRHPSNHGALEHSSTAPRASRSCFRQFASTYTSALRTSRGVLSVRPCQRSPQSGPVRPSHAFMRFATRIASPRAPLESAAASSASTMRCT